MFWNYVLPVLTALLGTVQLFKDWDNHKTQLRRAAVIVFIILIGLGGVASTYYTDRRNTAKRAEDQAQITALSKSVETANKAQLENTRLFTDKLAEFSQRLAILQTAIKTDELRKTAQKLQTELKATQVALVKPEAKLMFSFWRSEGLLENPFQETTLPVRDGIATISFSIINQSDVTAEDGEILLYLCATCSFAEEPQGFMKLPGMRDAQRNFVFGRILPRSTLQRFDVKVRVPEKGDIEVAMKYKCKSCIPEDAPQHATVHLFR